MKFKDYPSSLLNHLRGGFLRFAPFIIFVVICAASLIWNNNVPSHETAAHRIPVSFAAGACWGALSALAVRLAVERRACRAALTHALPSITSMIMAVIGAWFWYHMYETDAGYDFWEMLYFGSCVSIGAFAAAQLFGKRNAWTVFGRIFIAAVFAGLVLTVSPFNILDVPIMQQSARLRSALERSGCFVGGSLSVPEKPDIAEKEAKVIDGAWRYLTGCGRTFFGYTRVENLGTDPATAQAICIIFACYSRIMQHFKTDTLGTDLVSGQWSVS